MQEEKIQETPDLNHTLIYFTVSRTNDFAAKVTKRTRKIIGSKPGDILENIYPVGLQNVDLIRED